jgi:hypothetical protein
VLRAGLPALLGTNDFVSGMYEQSWDLDLSPFYTKIQELQKDIQEPTMVMLMIIRICIQGENGTIYMMLYEGYTRANGVNGWLYTARYFDRRIITLHKRNASDEAKILHNYN